MDDPYPNRDAKPKFPEDHDLVSFFRGKPDVTDPDVPWFYNLLSFKTEIAAFAISCRIAPADGEISLSITHAGQPLFDAEIRHIISLVIERRAGREALLVSLAAHDDDDEDGVFVLQLVPFVRVAWER